MALSRGPMGRFVERAVWTLIHDVIAHPLCGALWIAGLKRAGDRLHDLTLPPLSWRDELYGG